jgi:hypothetical protein
MGPAIASCRSETGGVALRGPIFIDMSWHLTRNAYREYASNRTSYASGHELQNHVLEELVCQTVV